METTSPFKALQDLQEEQREGWVAPTTFESSREAEIAELNQRLIDRQESFTAQIVRIEETWREKLRESQVCCDKQTEMLDFQAKRNASLSGALEDAISLLDRAVMEETPDDYGETYQAVSDVLAGKKP